MALGFVLYDRWLGHAGRWHPSVPRQIEADVFERVDEIGVVDLGEGKGL